MEEKRIIPEVKVIETEDGSSSLFVPALNETYHSFHGALRESEHVFIKQGLAFCRAEKELSAVNILEVGFGTGLNALLTLGYAIKNRIRVNYHSLEPFPLAEAIISQLNYPNILDGKITANAFFQLHKAPWNREVVIEENFYLQKIRARLEEFKPVSLFYDLVYYDAFAPNKQAELWTLEAFEKVYGSLKYTGVLVTYCAKGQFKRDLKAIGFEVQTLQGPPGKKEMVRAIKPNP